MKLRCVAAALAAVLPAVVCCAQATGFTYQGSLTDGGSAADGAYDLSFSLWDASDGGSQLGSPISLPGTQVESGTFTVTLDFGAESFASGPAWLQIGVDGQTLSPRQPVTGSPLALQTRGLFVDDADSFVGIGRDTQRTSQERFGIQTSAGAGQYGGMYMGADDEGARPFYGYATGDQGLMWHYYDGATHSWHLYNDGIRMTVTDYGFVGIGDTSPSSPLEVVTTTDNEAIVARNTRTGTNKAISGVQTDGTDSTGVLGITQQGSRGQGVWGASSNSQGVGVRGTATAGTGVIYGVLGEAYSASGYDFYAAGSGINYGAASSRRWKTNVAPIDEALAKVGRLRGVYFDWDKAHGGQHDIGMIAEEVGEVLPEIVAYEENGVDASGMDYTKLAPLLVEAVKALDAKHERETRELQSENEKLRVRVETLEAMVAHMLSNGDQP